MGPSHSTRSYNSELPIAVASRPLYFGLSWTYWRKIDFWAHPIGPAGTAVLIHYKPDSRGTWHAHGTHGLYLGPALQHYRTHRCLATHRLGTFVRHGCLFPQISSSAKQA